MVISHNFKYQMYIFEIVNFLLDYIHCFVYWGFTYLSKKYENWAFNKSLVFCLICQFRPFSLFYFLIYFYSSHRLSFFSRIWTINIFTVSGVPFFLQINLVWSLNLWNKRIQLYKDLNFSQNVQKVAFLGQFYESKKSKKSVGKKSIFRKIDLIDFFNSIVSPTFNV